MFANNTSHVNVKMSGASQVEHVECALHYSIHFIHVHARAFPLPNRCRNPSFPLLLLTKGNPPSAGMLKKELDFCGAALVLVLLLVLDVTSFSAATMIRLLQGGVLVGEEVNELAAVEFLGLS